MLAVLILWLGFVFTDSIPDCRVFGTVYSLPPEPSSFSREDRCAGIQDRLQDGELILWSEHWAVEVPLPANAANVALSYHWGSASAYLKGEAWPVGWTRVIRG